MVLIFAGNWKGVETGKVLRSCPDCIRDAVALTEEYLAAQKQN